jgi:hypothetical protein
MDDGTSTGRGAGLALRLAEASGRDGGPGAGGAGGRAAVAAPGSAVAGGPAAATAGVRRRDGALGVGVSWWRGPAWWPLVAVLAVQAGLSLRLVGANTAFQDEALYLWAGHRQWAHWLHGVAVPRFPAYFSGAPVIYPPAGALADSIGGLAAARVLSLVLMLAATALLWGTAGRLFGRRAAFFAAALFAVLGPVLHLGAFATYDALSVFLIAVAAWCVVRAGDRAEAAGWMIAAGAALALANAAAYSSALFDPVVLVLALVTALPRPGGKLAARRCALLAAVAGALLAAGLLAGGSSYLTGIGQTTLQRVASGDSPLLVLAHSWSWAGLIVVLAAGGIAVSWVTGPGRARTWLLAVLTSAALLGPLEQARLHTLASLNKHVGLGAWFAAIAAGYAADRFIAAAPAGRARALTCGACVVALAFPLTLGIGQSRQFATDWPDSTAFTAILRPLADHDPGHLLVEDPSIAEYYLPAGRQWQRWSSTRNIILPSGASTDGPSRAQGVTGPGNAAAFTQFIARGYFSLVALNFADTTPLDHRIAASLKANHHYHLIQVIPYGTGGTYLIWRYEHHP